MTIKTLRGTVTLDDSEGITRDNLIFQYESHDRTRGWRVTEAYLWPASSTTSVVGDDMQNIRAILATDQLGRITDNLLDISDTRKFGFLNQQYLLRNATTDFQTPNGQSIRDSAFLIDPDTIITNAVYLTVKSFEDGVATNVRNWSYLVIMKPLKISPEESILQQLKGIGQDVSLD